MSRRHAAVVRKINPDVRYNSTLLAKFINNVMSCGRKALASAIVYKAFSLIKRKYSLDPMDTFMQAVQNVRPFLEVKSVRVGGSNYQVPCALEDRRSTILTIRWLIKATKNRPEKSMVIKLAEELFDASNGKGGSVKLKDDTHKMAEANRAFAHFNPKKAKTKQ